MPNAIRFNQLGGPEVLHIEDMPDRRPDPGEVTLKVEAVGLNRAESMFYHGFYMEKVNVPSGLGYEAVGKVIAVGPEVDPTLIGKRFGTIPGFSMSQYPVLAEEAVVPASVLAAVPDSFSAVEGAAAWMQYCTAYGALVPFGKVAGGDFVIITAASSSVGLRLSRSSRLRAVSPSRPPAVPPRRINSSTWALTTSSSRSKRT
jgi:NADPH:quinone reductase-like Zn-dependent oxidoreductase